MNTIKYAGVIIDQVHPSLDKAFHYAIPDEMLCIIQLGMRVVVPFGPRRSMQGYVISLDAECPVPPDKIKPIKKLPDTYAVISEALLPMVWWMCSEYHCLAIEALRCFIPPGLRVNIKEKVQRVVYLNPEEDLDAMVDGIMKRSPGMAAVLKTLMVEDGLTVKEVLELSGATISSINTLVDKGYVTIAMEETYRSPFTGENLPTMPPVLNPEQRIAVSALDKGLTEGGTILLHGITGSGKTEVYMQAVEIALGQGKQAIVLVPEISLTPQTVGRFKGRFGENVAVLHSGLSIGERYDEWRRIKRKEVRIVVGARSAVFAPLEDIGIVIIDECHEDTYKSEVRPRYHAREIAEERCRLSGALLVLGSATPGLPEYLSTEVGRSQLVTLKKRADNQTLPKVEIVDMRTELQKGNRSIFSQSLYAGLDRVLRQGEQAILLLNRRGYAQFVSCRSCGYVVKCTECDISLTYHADRKSLICHYCGSQKPYPKICPSCESRYIKHFGTGTQRVEEDLIGLFPKVRLIRMDMDTTARKGSHHRMLDAFGSGQYDILLGTQMVAKGLDFPNVTLVGVIAADSALNLPDYRSCEKTFQLITQVAGRAGRGTIPGRVVVQTYQPDHYAIRYASHHDYTGFYQEERALRERFDYPPYAHIIRVLLTGENENTLAQYAQNMVKWIGEGIAATCLLTQGLIDVGVYPAPLERIKNKFRRHVLLRIKSDEATLAVYHALASDLIRTFYDQEIGVALDFNPTSLL